MGGMGHGADDVQAMAMDALQARIAPQLIEAVQRGISVQELANMLQVPENQAADLMQAVREGVLTLIAFLRLCKAFCFMISHLKCCSNCTAYVCMGCCENKLVQITNPEYQYSSCSSCIHMYYTSLHV